MNDNMVHRLSIDVNMFQSSEKADVTDEINELYQRFIQPTIEDVIEQYGAKYNFIVDQIDIDLGSIEKENIPHYLSIKLKEEFEKYIISSSIESSIGKEGKVNTHLSQQIQYNLSKSIKEFKTGKKCIDMQSLKDYDLIFRLCYEQVIQYLTEDKIPWYMESDEFVVDEQMEFFINALMLDKWQLQLFYERMKNTKTAFYRFIDLIETHNLFELNQKIITLGFVQDSSEIIKYFKNICIDNEIVAYFKQQDSQLIEDKVNIKVDAEFSYGDVRDKITKMVESILKLFTACLFGHLVFDRNVSSMIQRAVQQLKGVLNDLKEYKIRGGGELSESFSFENNSRGEVFFNDTIGHGRIYKKEHEQQEGERLRDRKQLMEELIEYMDEALQTDKFQLGEKYDTKESMLLTKDVRIHIEDAGLVLLHPFFTAFFDTLHLIDKEKKKFVSIRAQERAAHLLKYMTGYIGPHYGHLMLLEKMICGLPFDYPMAKDFEIKPEEEREVNDLLSSVCQYWKPLKESSKESLQCSFILRHGTLEFSDLAWVVRVEGSAIDILMEDLPWEISTIILPWLEPMIFVEWQME